MPFADPIQFETPENIQVSYRAAGLGTRFLAWFLDNILISVAIFVIFWILVCSGIASDVAWQNFPRQDKGDSPEETVRVVTYALGVFLFINGLGGFVYYVVSELSMRGQTWGKRQMGLRVVKANGFSLDATSIFVRNIFRLVDNLPIVWVVPFITQRSQRLGDLVAGTIVVVDEIERMTSVREVLAERSPLASKFRFGADSLKLARPEDAQAVEAILNRWSSLSPAERDLFLTRLVGPLAARLKMEMPAEADRVQFLEDFLTAVYRQQHQMLG